MLSSTYPAPPVTGAVTLHLSRPGPGGSRPARPVPKCQAAQTAARLELPPGNLGLPFIGETLRFTNDPDNTFHAERQEKYGRCYKTSLLGRNTVVVDDPEEVHRLLANDLRLMTVSWPKGIQDLLGDHAVSNTNGEKHQRVRKIMTQGFTKEAMATYIPRMAESFKNRMATWAGQDPLLLFPAAKEMVFEVTARLLLGFDMGEALLQKAWRLETQLSSGMFVLPIEAISPKFREGKAARKELLEMTEKIIRDLPEIKDPTALSIKQGATAFQLLQGATDDEGNKATMEELTDMAVNIYFAGTETTSFTLTHTMVALAKRPDLVARLKQEQKQMIEKHGEQITSAVLEDMTLAEACTREMLRFKPSVTSIFRQAEQDLTVCGYHVPKGWHLNLRMLQGHVEDDTWPDRGREFDPDRWFEADGATLIKEPRHYIPFSEGPRFCLGWRLAKDEDKIFMALLARHCTSWEHLNPETILHVPLGEQQDKVKMRMTFSEALQL